jgi:hypothetical protein
MFNMMVLANDFDYTNLEPLKLTTPEMKPELVLGEMPANPFADSKDNLEASYSDMQAHGMDFDFFKSKTNPGVKPYKFMDDMTFVGLPLFVAGWAIKSDKAMFRVNQKAEAGGKKNTQLLSDFKTGIDDYLQFFGPTAVVGLKLAGVEGRSDWPRLLANAALSYGIMAGFVNGIKYTAKEMRPDGSTANSWPSGHTATAFVGATLLHKEYGLTRSPWYSVAGYGLATATGVMRVLNNRHWVSDVMSGAGIGILSTELGYAVGDLLFKGKGLLRNDLQMDFENPSFFSVSMGVGLGNKSLEFSYKDRVDRQVTEDIDLDEEMKDQVEFRAATVVDAEGAYFFNKYVGVGGRLRVRAMSAKTFGQYAETVQIQDWDAWGGLAEAYYQKFPKDYSDDPLSNAFTYLEKIGLYDFTNFETPADAPVTDIYGVVKSDHLAEFTSSLGLYFNLPLSKHFAIGAKALIGRSFTQELDIDGYAEGYVRNIDYKIGIESTGAQSGYVPNVVVTDLSYPTNTGEKWSDEWDYLTIGAKSSTSYGTGISLTYKYKSNFSWRLFCDYDYTEKDFTLKFDPYHFLKNNVTDGTYTFMQAFSEYASDMNPIEYKKTKKMNYVTIGLSFLVNI